MIEFSGITSDERFLVVEHYPKRSFPKRKYETVQIPGRSGDIYMEQSEDAFENYTQAYSVFLNAESPGLPIVARGVAEWLLGSTGYQRLEDSYDPDFYRMAVYSGGEEFTNTFNEYGQGNLTFNCAPQRWYKSGEMEKVVSNGGTLVNPSPFRAKPILKFHAETTDGVLIVLKNQNGTERQFRISGTVNGDITIDSERHTIKDASGTSYNSAVLDDYENLFLEKQTTIGHVETQISNLRIIPRWWTI